MGMLFELARMWPSKGPVCPWSKAISGGQKSHKPKLSSHAQYPVILFFAFDKNIHEQNPPFVTRGAALMGCLLAAA
jgi:hypothetical protein